MGRKNILFMNTFDELYTHPTRAHYDIMTQGSCDAQKQSLWFFLATVGVGRSCIAQKCRLCGSPTLICHTPQAALFIAFHACAPR